MRDSKNLLERTLPKPLMSMTDLPDSLFSTAEMSDDCVSKFASLVCSRDEYYIKLHKILDNIEDIVWLKGPLF